MQVAYGQPACPVVSQMTINISVSDSTPSFLHEEKEKKKISLPAILMAEASLLLQKAALLEQDNFKSMLWPCRRKKVKMKFKRYSLNCLERKSTRMLLKKW